MDELARKSTCIECGATNIGTHTECLRCQATLPIPVIPDVPAQIGNECPSCGIDNKPESRYCMTCGVKLAQQPLPESSATPKPAFCSKCGSALKPEQNFCITCGHRV